MHIYKNTLLAICLLFSTASFSQIITYPEFLDTYDNTFKSIVSEGLINYESLKNNDNFLRLLSYVESASIENWGIAEQKSFRINAYNIAVIDQILAVYPINSVQEISGFFDSKKRILENKSLTLNDYEKNYILKIFDDPRLHFVLVCGALDCPPLTNKAFRPESLENQLLTQTTKAINNPKFIKSTTNEVAISQIFKWYPNDFGQSTKNHLEFINQYRIEKLGAIENNAPNQDLKVSYYDYNWSLNSINPIVNSSKSNSEFRYVVSAAIPKGTYEIKLFNNLYSQTTGNDYRSTFYTSTLNALYGYSNRLNIGLNGRYRLVSNHNAPSHAFQVFNPSNAESKRSGLTALGPQIRYAPSSRLPNFTIQTSITFPIGKELEGESGQAPFIDWSGVVVTNQFFNDFTLNNYMSLFTEIDLIVEDIGFDLEQNLFRFSTPATVILSYFPHPKSTIYVLSGFSPFWQQQFDYFFQAGGGTKYQLNPDFEIELLYTYFNNKFLLSDNGSANTYNFGLRYSIR